MLCRDCKGQFGWHYHYLIQMLEEYMPQNKGEEITKQKILDIFKKSEIKTPTLKEEIQKIKERLDILEVG